MHQKLLQNTSGNYPRQACYWWYINISRLVQKCRRIIRLEDVSYDVESLFTSIPVKETINYIIQKIYVRKEINPFCKKSTFLKLLKKLTQEYVFTINNRLIKQVNGCPTGRLISVVFSGIYICKIFYKRYVHDTYVRRKKHETD